jgi:tetratricopeptide (TPR) repeat protein
MGEDNNLEPAGNDPRLGADDVNAEEGASTPPAADAPASGKGLTPGQRLAARKAQKAQEKRDFKEELRRKEEEKREQEQEEANRIFARPKGDAEGLPEDVQKVAGSFTHFMQENRVRILGVIGVALVGFAVWQVLSHYVFTGSAEQAASLTKALETASAQVDPAATSDTTEDGRPVFKTREERDNKAIDAFEAAIKRDPKSTSAGWAALGEASLKLQLEKPDGALKLYERAFAEHKDVQALAVRALEGIGLSLEAAGKLDDAAKRYEELKTFNNGSDKDLAEYHLGRLKLEKGDKEGAKALLKPLYDRLGEHREGVPPSRYLRNEVEIRLAEIDSSLVDKGAGGGEPSQFSQEELQRLLEQLRQQQGGGGGAP